MRARLPAQLSDTSEQVGTPADEKGYDNHGSVAFLRTGSNAGQNEPLPAALHGSGEALRDLWSDPNGVAVLVGYMYTGKPGPDTGVAYGRLDGVWSISFTKRSHELQSVWGSDAKNIWVGGSEVLAQTLTLAR